VQLSLERRVAEAWPTAEWRDAHVLIAVSGGADSVALLRAVLSLKKLAGGHGAIYAAHFNHGLRGPAADDDQAWLEALCERLGVALTTGRADVSLLAAEQGDGWESAARGARYDFLRGAAEQIGARFLAAGHTADDQAETVLHRIVRGTGLAGVAGIPATRPLSPSVALVRPILEVGRRDVLGYLAAIGQDYRADATNADPRFTRNRLRHGLLPAIRGQFNPDVDAALVRLARQAAEAQQWIAEQAERLADEAVNVESRDRVRIDCGSLQKQPDILQREVCKVAWMRAGWPLQSADYDVWQQLARLVQAGENRAKFNLPGQILAVREAGDIVLSRASCFS
jgi:tRNA(Ile)-lysidine synthase